MDIIPQAPVRIFGLPFEGFNVATLYNSWLVMGILIAVGWLGARSLQMVPGRAQAALELIAEFFADLCDSSLGEQHGRKFMPFITTLFLFVLLANVMGAIPNFLAPLGWPGFYSPTQDLNTPLGLAVIVVFVVHISGIRVKGFRGWLWSFFEPSFPADRKAGRVAGLISLGAVAALDLLVLRAYLTGLPEMAAGARIGAGVAVGGLLALSGLVTVYALQLGRVPNVAMAPLNVVGELGKAISHPFRLFGNIFGGFVILVVISHLIRYVGLPPLLSVFFDLFIGLVHAFVFAMLALAYTAVQIRD